MALDEKVVAGIIYGTNIAGKIVISAGNPIGALAFGGARLAEAHNGKSINSRTGQTVLKIARGAGAILYGLGAVGSALETVASGNIYSAFQTAMSAGMSYQLAREFMEYHK